MRDAKLISGGGGKDTLRGRGVGVNDVTSRSGSVIFVLHASQSTADADTITDLASNDAVRND